MSPALARTLERVLFRPCSWLPLRHLRAPGPAGPLHEREPGLLFERLHLALWVMVAANAVFAAADLSLTPPPGPLLVFNLLQIAPAVIALWLMRGPLSEPWAVGLGVTTFVTATAMTAATAVYRHDQAMAPLLCGFLSLGVAALIPWGLLPQLTVAVAAALSITASAYVLGHPLGYPALTGLVTIAASVYITDQLHRQRIALAQERRRANAALREIEQRFRATFEQAAVGIAHVTPGGTFQRVNQRWCDILGYTRPELECRTFQDITYPDDLGADLDYVRQMLAGEIARYSMEKRYVHRDGSLIWANLTVALVHDAAGAPAYFISVIEDISERKRAEEEIHRLNTSLEARSHLLELSNEELEAFSYSVSHDLRAPLRAIDGFSLQLVEDHGDSLQPAARVCVERVRGASRRMGHIIQDLLALSHVTRAELRRGPVDLSDLTRTIAAELCEREPTRVIEFVTADGAIADGDPNLLRIALENLVGNAWKYTAKRARARIEFSIADRQGTPVYCVSDDGAGFDGHYAEKLFDPFQRLHSASEFEGTGIGLAIVARIVSRHGGRIWAEGAVEHGAAFYFTLGPG